MRSALLHTHSAILHTFAILHMILLTNYVADASVRTLPVDSRQYFNFNVNCYFNRNTKRWLNSASQRLSVRTRPLVVRPRADWEREAAKGLAHGRERCTMYAK